MATDDGFPGAPYLGYAWTDPRTYSVRAHSNEFGDISVGTSAYGPSLAVDYIPDNHNFYIAWTGVDRHLRYGVLDATRNHPGNNPRAASQYGPALAGLSGRLDAARTGTGNRLNALDPANGVRPFGGPVTVTGQGAPSPAADGDLYSAWMDRNAEIQTGDVNERAGRDTGELNHNVPSRATDVAGTRRTGWTREEDFSLFGGDLESKTV